MKKHFISFYSPGTFLSESTELEIDSWDVQKAEELSTTIVERYGAKPYGFRFKTKERAEGDLDSRVSKTSGMYFLGGTVLTLDQVKEYYPNEEILIWNMEVNKIKRVIRNDNSYTSFLPFEDSDVLLPDKTLVWSNENAHGQAHCSS